MLAGIEAKCLMGAKWELLSRAGEPKKKVQNRAIRYAASATTNLCCFCHIADYFLRLAECLLSGVKRTRFHAAQHVPLISSAMPPAPEWKSGSAC